MKPVLSAKQMQACDQNTIINHKIPSLVLMERAALSVAQFIKEKFNTDTVIGIICGSGNNGGDGIAIARLLHLWGYKVNTGIIGSPTKYSEQMIQEIEIANSYNMYITCILDKNIDDALAMFEGCDVIVDAIFGIGLSREVDGLHKTAIEFINNLDTSSSNNGSCNQTYVNQSKKPYIIAVDIPSGISSDTGNVLGVAIKADETITFAYNKLGLLISDGYIYSGKVTVADVGIYLDKCDTFILDDNDLKLIPQRPINANKGTCGKVLIVAGCSDIYGACYLSAKAALVTGSGLVKIYTHENNRESIQQMLPEAMCTTYESTIDTKKLSSLIYWADSIVIGPGLSTGHISEELLKYTLENATCPIVIDADGLNILSKHLYWINKYNSRISSSHNSRYPLYNPDIGLHNFNSQLILTPHIKEMSRLCQKETTVILKELKNTAVEFASEYNCIVDLKNFTSFISIAGTQNYINTTGNESMATPGSGDVLAGIIGSLIGQGITPHMAAPLGAYIHGKAGEKASLVKGINGVLASDIIDYISF